MVWHYSGPVAAGTMLAGLAAGLQPQSVDWEAGTVANGWAASIAGDLGQTARKYSDLLFRFSRATLFQSSLH